MTANFVIHPFNVGAVILSGVVGRGAYCVTTAGFCCLTAVSHSVICNVEVMKSLVRWRRVGSCYVAPNTEMFTVLLTAGDVCDLPFHC